MISLAPKGKHELGQYIREREVVLMVKRSKKKLFTYFLLQTKKNALHFVSRSNGYHRLLM